MKLQNMKLSQKWREYAGPKDERLETGGAKSTSLGSCCRFGMLHVACVSNQLTGSVGAH